MREVSEYVMCGLFFFFLSTHATSPCFCDIFFISLNFGVF